VLSTSTTPHTKLYGGFCVLPSSSSSDDPRLWQLLRQRAAGSHYRSDRLNWHIDDRTQPHHGSVHSLTGFKDQPVWAAGHAHAPPRLCPVLGALLLLRVRGNLTASIPAAVFLSSYRAAARPQGRAEPPMKGGEGRAQVFGLSSGGEDAEWRWCCCAASCRNSGNLCFTA
jgi:hypothetical protein